ncbi:hypothetical protein [uncultured Methylobacterium sp.]|uniref:hypothetical protein n=1 Tax=uncultured Methylobacterium sp. TaxID=157278 RepID=UPI0035CAA9B9
MADDHKTPKDADKPGFQHGSAKSGDDAHPDNHPDKLDERLDDALEETFPSSDPISVKITK